MFDVELLQFRHHFRQIVVRRRRQMKSAGQRVDLVDVRNFPRAPDRVDDPGVAARANDNEAAITEPETCGVLVPMLIGHWIAGKLFRGKMVIRVATGVATEPVANAIFHPGVRQDLLDAGAGAQRQW